VVLFWGWCFLFSVRVTQRVLVPDTELIRIDQNPPVHSDSVMTC
jgi:hypothetical protein